MRKCTFLLTVFLLLGKLLLAQGEANIWYFGDNAGLDFNGGAPVPLTNGQMFIDEGCGSISDAGGNLLFYTNGMFVWNRNHVQMPNGSGLMGNASAAQSGLIIQRPGSTAIYYIFTATDQANPGGIRYSEVNMALNGGLGDVTANKNILLINPSCEKITGIRHCNNRDVWVLTHDWGTNTFRNYLVTAAGVNTTPVVSSTGLVNTGGPSNMNAIGCLKGSPDGKKLASSIQDDNRFELFDFDNATGIVSNGLAFPVIPGTTYAYGVEFSPDGSRLYVSSPTPGNIYQYDMCAGSNAAILNSRTLVGSSTNFIGTLQLGPDKKIYLAQWASPILGVINNPNTLGVGCNYVNGVNLAGKNSRVGLPNFVPYYYPRNFQVTDTCLVAAFTAPTYSISTCSGITNGINSVSWNFGDPTSGPANTSASTAPTHTFTSAGTFTVTLVIGTGCGNDTILQSVTVTSCSFAAIISATNPLCNAQCIGTATATPSSGTPPYSYLWSNTQTTQTITGLCAGNYSVVITDASLATVTASVTITQPAALTTSVTSTVAGCGMNNGSAMVNAVGGTPGYAYSWNTTPVQTTPTATGLPSGNYTVSVTDANGCTQTQSATIASSGTFSITATSTPAGCTVANGTAQANATAGTAPFTYAWNNGASTSSATGLAAGNYTVTITDTNGCTGTQTVMVTQTTGTPATATASPISIALGDSTVLSGSGGVNYLWSPVDGLSCITCQNPVAKPTTTTVYCVMVTDTNNCTDSACVIIYIEPTDCSTASIEKMYLPSAFSPNGDDENESIGISFEYMDCIETFQLDIFNRWGEKVFSTNNPDILWDGTHMNQAENTAVLTYYLNATLSNGQKIQKKGNIGLFR